MMTNDTLHDRFERLSTAAIADACHQQDTRRWTALGGVRPVVPGGRCAGRLRNVRYRGEVADVLAVVDRCAVGDVLLIDNGGRTDHACLGAIVAMRATAAGVAGLIVWGCHRDTAHLLAIDLPVFSLGATPLCAPRPDALSLGSTAPLEVCDGDVTFADEDGVLIVAASEVEPVLIEAEAIAQRESALADAIAFQSRRGWVNSGCGLNRLPG